MSTIIFTISSLFNLPFGLNKYSVSSGFKIHKYSPSDNGFVCQSAFLSV